MPNSSSTPTGNIFNNTPSANAGDSTQQQQSQQTANNSEPDGNDSLQSLVTQLTSGVVIPNNEGSNQSTNNRDNQQQQQQQATPPTPPENPQTAVINNMMQEFRGQSLTEGVDMDAIAERMQNGDLGGIVEAIETTSGKAVERALSSVLTLIPEIISQTEQQVLAKVGQLNSSDKVWDQFLSKYPDYAEHKGTVREHLQRAVDSGADLEQSFQAVDLIFGNLKKPVKKPAASFTPESGSEAFSLQEYAGNPLTINPRS